MIGLKFQKIWLSMIANKNMKTDFPEERVKTAYVGC